MPAVACMPLFGGISLPLLCLRKLWRVSYVATGCQRARAQLCGHEHLIRHVELALEPEAAAALKPEAWIVCRVPYHDDRLVPHAAASLETAPDQLGANALVLPGRTHGHRTEPSNLSTRPRTCDRRSGEQNVAHNTARLGGYERDAA